MRILIVAAAAVLLMAAGAADAKGSHTVKGHTTKSGKYVAPTRATNPDKTKRNNYGSKGNSNPANGKQGTKDPEK